MAALEDFRQLANSVRDFLPSNVPRLSKPPTPMEFLRNYVMPNRPVIIEGGMESWKCMKTWNEAYFRKTLAPLPLKVNFTPNGRADAVLPKGKGVEGGFEHAEGTFIMPEERVVSVDEFFDAMADKENKKGIAYFSEQNGCFFASNFSEFLGEDVPPHVDWASKALGGGGGVGELPDAVNLWIGDERSVSSLHKDPYENIYCVVTGEKIFHLLHPTDLPFVYQRLHKVGQYKQKENGSWEVLEMDGDIRPWIELDLSNPDCEKFPLFSHAQVYTVSVKAGEMLYLPQMWFHQVTQRGLTIAVNYWYDMSFDSRYGYYGFLEKMTQKAGMCELLPEPEFNDDDEEAQEEEEED